MDAKNIQESSCVVVKRNDDKAYFFWKRFLDVTLSLIALVPASLVCFIVSVCIIAEDGFPVFFVQERTKNSILSANACA